MTPHHSLSYWGKADPAYPGEPKWHPLAYHCLDVAAVACAWWESCASLRGNFAMAFPAEPDKERLRAWVLFFVALHDLGKFDLRFQLKALDALAAAGRKLTRGEDHDISLKEIADFDHGHAGIAWARREYPTWLAHTDGDLTSWSCWEPWLAAVTGHHGDYCPPLMEGLAGIEADDALIGHDREARQAFVVALETLFLRPAGLSLQDLPPVCSLPARALLAGFCASCDWLGSNVTEFDYRARDMTLQDYLDERVAHIESSHLLESYGLFAPSKYYAGLATLLKTGESPRGVQTEIDGLPAVPSLTLIEAPTGSGKTEAALAYAWRLLAMGVADSIVFALPTQATANAMLKRVEAFAMQAYGKANVVLAHGKSKLNENFQALVERGQHLTAQGREEAAVQCAAWLASSRKRVFLGQIGVCTVDQVLLSVLPVRHKFVRGFGLAKSVLIVDEVHAYDAYMHGLLGEVLKNQKACGGSAVLLSATLPARLRAKLLAAWNSRGPDVAPYPALWHATGGETEPKTVMPEHRPPRREVGIECLRLAGAFPDDALIDRIVAAGESGALVAVVVNLVDDAQRLARLLRERTQVEVDVFHARYRFVDRQRKEAAVLLHYGRNAPRTAGRILVATQVVEQSLDLDFDWLLTQICPVDLLFQRLGRLHRHVREKRPSGFEAPRCTVLTVEGDDYGVFELIYGHARVLWRTDTLLARHDTLIFPEAYRDWIEQVYQRDDWEAEPERIACDFTRFSSVQMGREKDAQRLTTMTVSSFRDEDDRVTGLTRDGEMSLTLLPVTADGRLLDGRRIKDIPEHELAEALNLGAVPAPASWKKMLHDCPMDTDGPLAGYRQLVMSAVSEGRWQSRNGMIYSHDFGLEKRSHESA
ncbi:MAG: CRISPR-associated helicase/endonuclease Cas3 [Immundisolibacter sp.]|uniref:CRISPR-associated helicase/endonuclease Cas3 n=1 Tax=Immundisolibacter sp. TaxID=1934948 RepID=UPI003EE08290